MLAVLSLARCCAVRWLGINSQHKLGRFYWLGFRAAFCSGKWSPFQTLSLFPESGLRSQISTSRVFSELGQQALPGPKWAWYAHLCPCHIYPTRPGSIWLLGQPHFAYRSSWHILERLTRPEAHHMTVPQGEKTTPSNYCILLTGLKPGGHHSNRLPLQPARRG